MQFRKLINQIILKRARVIDEAVKAANIGSYNRGISRILVWGGSRYLTVANLASNVGNFLKYSPH
jgi:hypothetical protein